MFAPPLAEASAVPPLLARTLGDIAAHLLPYGVRLQMVTSAGQTIPLHTASQAVFRSNAVGLTATEWRIALMVSHGSTNREVAEARSLSTKTVESHLSHIYRKLGLRSRAELAVWVHDAIGSNAP